MRAAPTAAEAGRRGRRRAGGGARARRRRGREGLRGVGVGAAGADRLRDAARSASRPTSAGATYRCATCSPRRSAARGSRRHGHQRCRAGRGTPRRRPRRPPPPLRHGRHGRRRRRGAGRPASTAAPRGGAGRSDMWSSTRRAALRLRRPAAAVEVYASGAGIVDAGRRARAVRRRADDGRRSSRRPPSRATRRPPAWSTSGADALGRGARDVREPRRPGGDRASAGASAAQRAAGLSRARRAGDARAARAAGAGGGRLPVLPGGARAATRARSAGRCCCPRTPTTGGLAW